MLLRLPIVVAALALLAIGCKEEAERPVVSPVSDVQPQPEELKEQTNVASSEKVVPAGIGVSRALAIEKLEARLGVVFRDASAETPAEHLFQAVFEGVHIKLWGQQKTLKQLRLSEGLKAS